MQSLGRIVSETDPIGNRREQFSDARLVYGRYSLSKRIDFVRVNVETTYVMTYIRETKAGCQAHVPGSDHTDFHFNP